MKLGLYANLSVTLMTILMVIGMPLTDHFLCKKLGISPDDRLSKNPEADHYLHLRKIVLILVFAAYVFLLSYVVFFSRSASDDYLVHVALYEDLANAVQIDYGILGFIKDIFTNGISSAMEHVKVNKIEDIYQVYVHPDGLSSPLCLRLLPQRHESEGPVGMFHHDAADRKHTADGKTGLL